MPVPPGVTMIPIRINPPPGVSTGNLRVRATPSISLKWGTTGVSLASIIAKPARGVTAVAVPAVNQAGFQTADGQAFQGWSYILTVDGSIAGVPFSSTRLIAPVVSDGSIDLDVISVPGGSFTLPTRLSQATLDATYAPQSLTAQVDDLQGLADLAKGEPGEGFTTIDTTGFLGIITDSDGRVLGGWNSAGHFVTRLAGDTVLRGDQIQNDSVGDDALDPDILARLLANPNVGGMLETSETSTGYLLPFTDANGRLLEISIDSTGRLAQWAVDAIASRMTVNPFEPTPVTVTVKKSGGDFSTVEAALAAAPANAATERSPVIVEVHPGIYTRTVVGETVVPPHVSIVGTDKAHCHLHLEVALSLSDADLANCSTLLLKKTATVKNLTVTVRNGRYAVHDEEAALNPDSVHRLENVDVEHQGNQDVIDYRAANGLPAGSPWNSWVPYGHGTASGQDVTLTDVSFVGERGAWFVHNLANFAKPAKITHVRSRFSADDTMYGPLGVQGLGSGTADSVHFVDCQFGPGFYIAEVDTPWLATAADKQPANHSEWSVIVAGSSGVVGFRTGNRGKALRIASAATSASSSVRVAGSAVPALFGDATAKDGGGGLRGYIFGALDISGILVGNSQTVANTIGRRLGNCTSATKTLAVTFESGTTATVTFDQDYTAISNATILASINSVLGSAGTADEYQVSQGETYPRFLDREILAVNGGTVGIPRWSAVKVHPTRRTRFALMTTADPASMLAGVSLDPIAPGKRGRILRRGSFSHEQLAGITAYIENGAPIYLSDTVDGQFAATGTKQVAVGTMDDFAILTTTGAL